MKDRTFGAVCLTALSAGFLYYTVWALVVPLIDDGHPVLKFFPHHDLAVAVPAYLGVGVVSVSFFLVGLTMILHRPLKED